MDYFLTRILTGYTTVLRHIWKIPDIEKWYLLAFLANRHRTDCSVAMQKNGTTKEEYYRGASRRRNNTVEYSATDEMRKYILREEMNEKYLKVLM